MAEPHYSSSPENEKNHQPNIHDQTSNSDQDSALDVLLKELDTEDKHKAGGSNEEDTDEPGTAGHPIPQNYLNTDPTIGLNTTQVDERLKKIGLNSLEGKKQSEFLKFLSYFVGPIQFCMMGALALAIGLFDWIDVGVICALLILNAIVGFWQEHQAHTMVDSLKQETVSKATVLRDREWQEIDPIFIVPGDILKIEEGTVVAADGEIVNEDGQVQIDHAPVTGESEAIKRAKGQTCYASGTIKRGEAILMVTSTGKHTVSGKAVAMTEAASMEEGHFTKVVNSIGTVLLSIIVFVIFIIWIAGFFRSNRIKTMLEFTMALAIVGVPVALPVVVTTTMTVGAAFLAKKKAAVQNLSAIESLAGVEILCSDKTGTLTKNQLSIGEPYLMGDFDVDDLMLAGCLAASRKIKGIEPIDKAFLQSLAVHKKAKANYSKYTVQEFQPFDPVIKKVTVTVTNEHGEPIQFTKGAPLIILRTVAEDGHLDEQTQRDYEDALARLAGRGLRAIGVARKRGDGPWELMGLVSLSDPPRDDTAQTIIEARALGLGIKMLTGDARDIAQETSRVLGLGTNIYKADRLMVGDSTIPGSETAEFILKADGFAAVFPEHKYQVVESLQRSGYLVAMTGDGGNDAPSLKKADTGIAVEGATDAARNAADIVFSAPGLSAVIDAIKTARKIFHRMYAYVIYRIALSMHLLIYLGIQQIVFNNSMDVRLVVFLAIFCDIATLMIAYDNAPFAQKPVKWNLPKLWGMSIILGIVLAAGSWIVHATLVSKDVEGVVSSSGLVQHYGAVDGIMFLEIALTENWLIFLTRAKGAFWKGGRKLAPSWQLVLAVFLVDIIASIFCGFGVFSSSRTDIVTIVKIWVASVGVFLVCAAVYTTLDAASWFDNACNGRFRKADKSNLHERQVAALESIAIAYNNNKTKDA